MQYHLKTVSKLCYSPKTEDNKNSVPLDSMDLGYFKTHALIE